ncbi:MAG: tetratricopeptide repeat protein [bacterium]|nr:tetratricopeptide repeat protein [bacterium]
MNKAIKTHKKRILTLLICSFLIPVLFAGKSTLSGKEKTVPLYRLLFTESEWKNTAPAIPALLAKTPKNIFASGEKPETQFLLGAWPVITQEGAPPTPYYYIPRRVHININQMLQSKQGTDLYNQARKMFNHYSDTRYNGLKLDIRNAIREALIINHYYNNKSSFDPAALNALYQAINILFKETLSYEHFLHPNRERGATVYTTYLEFISRKQVDPLFEQKREIRKIYGILNYLCYHYLDEINDFILKKESSDPAARPVLYSAAYIHQQYGRYNKAITILEKLAALEPGKSSWLVRLGNAYAKTNNPKFKKILAKAVSQNPALQAESDRIHREWNISRELDSWNSDWKGLSKEESRKRWFKIARLLLEANRMKDLNDLTLSIPGSLKPGIKSSKEFKIFTLELMETTIMRDIYNNIFSLMMNPSLITQMLLSKHAQVNQYYTFTIKTIGTDPGESRLLRHLYISSLEMMVVDAANKVVSFTGRQKDRALTRKEKIEIIEKVQIRWDSMLVYAEKISKTSAQKKIVTILTKTGNDFFPLLKSDNFRKAVESDQLFKSASGKKLWKLLSARVRDCKNISRAKGYPGSNEALFIRFSFDRLNTWMAKKDSLKKFIALLDEMEQVSGEADDNPLKIISWILDILNNKNREFLGSFQSYPGVSKKFKAHLGQFRQELGELTSGARAFIAFYEKQQGSFKDRFWQLRLPYDTYTKLAAIKKRYLSEKPLENYFKALFLLMVHANTNDQKYIPKVFHYLNSALEDMAQSEKTGTNRNFVVINSEQTKLRYYLYQNTGYCLGHSNHPFTFFFTENSRLNNSMRDLNILFILDHQLALLRPNPSQFTAALEKTYGDIQNWPELSQEEKDKYSKPVLARLVRLSKDTGDSARAKQYGDLYEKLEAIPIIPTATFSIGLTYGTATGLELRIDLYKNWFREP